MLKSKKIVLLFLVIVLSVTMAAISVACTNKPIILSSLEGLDAEIDVDARSVRASVDSSVSTLKLPKPLLTEEGEVGYEYYRDRALSERIESDTIELEYGNNIFYLKVYFTEAPKKFVEYHFIVTRSQPQVPDNEGSRQYGPFDDVFDGVFDFTDTGIRGQQPSGITKEELAALIKPYYIESLVASGLTAENAEKAFESYVDKGAFEDSAYMLSVSGIGADDLSAVLDKAEKVWPRIVSVITQLSAEDANVAEVVASSVADAEFIQDIFDWMNFTVNEIADTDAFNALIGEFVKEFSALGGYLIMTGYRDISVEEFRDILDVGGQLDLYDDTYATYAAVTESLNKAVYSEEVRKCIDGFRQGILNVSGYSPEKIGAAVATVAEAVNLVMGDEATINELLEGKSDVSLKDMVAALNEAGDILFAFLDGFGDMNEFSDTFADFMEMLSRISNDDTLRNFAGAPGVLYFVAEVFSELTVEDYTALYADFDDAFKEETLSAEKVGYFIAKATIYLSDAYAHLGEGAKNTILYVLKLCGLISEATTVEDMNFFVLNVTSMKEEHLTDNVCRRIYEDFNRVFFDEDALGNFGNSSVIIPVGATTEEVTEALSRNDNYIYLLMEAAASGVKSVTVSCDTSETGYRSVIIYFDGKASKTTEAFVYDPDDIASGKAEIIYYYGDRIMYMASELNGEPALSDLKSLVEPVPYLFYKNEYYLINAADILNFEDFEYIGLDTSVANVEKAAKVRVGTYGFGYLEFPFVYYVYDKENPVVTGAYIYLEYNVVPVGATEEDLGAEVSYIYDYGFYGISGDPCPFTVEFSADVPGKTKAIFKCSINGEERIYTETVTVLSEEDYYVISDNYNSYDWVMSSYINNSDAYQDVPDLGWILVVNENETIEELMARWDMTFSVRIPFAWPEGQSANFIDDLTYAELKSILEKCGYSLSDNLVSSATSSEKMSLELSIIDPTGKTVIIGYPTLDYVVYG